MSEKGLDRTSIIIISVCGFVFVSSIAGALIYNCYKRRQRIMRKQIEEAIELDVKIEETGIKNENLKIFKNPKEIYQNFDATNKSNNLTESRTDRILLKDESNIENEIYADKEEVSKNMFQENETKDIITNNIINKENFFSEAYSDNDEEENEEDEKDFYSQVQKVIRKNMHLYKSNENGENDKNDNFDKDSFGIDIDDNLQIKLRSESHIIEKEVYGLSDEDDENENSD
jgi:hypothetical protein